MDTKKIIQALAFFAYHQPNHKLDNMKAYKLLWLSDRYQLRHSGRFLSGDKYFAMPFGPVPSDAKNILEGKPTIKTTDINYVNEYLKLNGKRFEAVKNPDLRAFSISDREVLNQVLNLFGEMTSQQLSALSHQFPEWLAYKDMIQDENSNNSYPINVDYFFEDSDADDKGFFDDEFEALGLARDLYHQNNRN